MSTPSEIHNKLAAEFVLMAGTETKSREELMVVVDSTMLAAMHLLVRRHSVSPTHASDYMEAALQASTERFTGDSHAQR